MDDLKLHASNKESLDSLIQTVRVFSHDIGMEFGVEKCEVLTMKKGNMANSDGIALPNKTAIKRPKECDSYKYLGVIQVDGMKHHRMKGKVKTVYYRRLRKILEMKLNGGNIITGKKIMGNFITKMLCCLSTLDRGIIRANGEENKNINDDGSGTESYK